MQRCAACGALNPEGAGWCGQCLERFVPPRSDGRGEGDAALEERESQHALAGAARRPSPTSTAPRPAGDTAGAFRATEEGIAWTCRVCGSDNELEASACRVCGASLADTLRPPEPGGPIRDPGTAALVSLAFPGAGHAYLGMWGQAIARAVTSAWVATVALVAAFEQGLASPLAIVFGLASFALWVTAAHDSYRESRRERGAVLLAGRTFFWCVLGLLLLSVAMVFAAALGGR